jgi:GTP-binding protein
VQDLGTVREELAAYDSEIGKRPFVIVGTKADLADDDARQRLRGALAEFGEVVVVSGVTGEGVYELEPRLQGLAREAEAASEPRQSYVVLRPGREQFQVRKEGDRYRVIGRDVERWVLETDLDDPRSVRGLQRQLAKAGVERHLATAGARRGDEVVIGDNAFEFYPEDLPEEDDS